MKKSLPNQGALGACKLTGCINFKKAIPALLLCFIYCLNAFGQDPWLLKDINVSQPNGPVGEAGSWGGISAASKSMFSANGLAFFTADDGVHGLEMWRTDGTPAGTYMLADITPGAAATTFSDVYEAGNLLYFTTGAAINNTALWRTDGTTAGTYVIMSNTNGHGVKTGSGLNDGVLNYSTQMGNYYYFTVTDTLGDITRNGINYGGNYHDRIYKTDGTVAGTTLYYDAGAIAGVGYETNVYGPDWNGFLVGQISQVIAVGNTLYVIGANNFAYYYNTTTHTDNSAFAYNRSILSGDGTSPLVNIYSPAGQSGAVVEEAVNVNNNYLLMTGTMGNDPYSLYSLTPNQTTPVLLEAEGEGYTNLLDAGQNLGSSRDYAVGSYYFFRNADEGVSVTNGTVAGTFAPSGISSLSLAGATGIVNNKMTFLGDDGKIYAWDGSSPTNYQVVSDSLTGKYIDRAIQAGNWVLYLNGQNNPVQISDLTGGNCFAIYPGRFDDRGMALNNTYLDYGATQYDGSFDAGYEPHAINSVFKLFTGAVSNAWNNAANWLPNGVPAATDNVMIPQLSAAKYPVISSSAACHNLTIFQSTLTINSGANLDINGYVARPGATITGAGSITLKGPATKLYGATPIGFPQYSDIPDLFDVANVNISGSDICFATPNATFNSVVNFKTDNKILASYTALTFSKKPFITGYNNSRFIVTNDAKTQVNNNVIYNGAGSSTTVDSLFTIPVGTSASSYTPVSFSYKYDDGPDFGVGVADSVYRGGTSGGPFGGAMVNKTWTITGGSAKAGNKVGITLDWNAGDQLTGFTPNACFIANYTGSKWSFGAAKAAALNNSLYSVAQTYQASQFSTQFIVSSNVNLSPALSALAISPGTLSPVFSTGTTAYTALVANPVSSITITPATTDATDTITVNGVTVASGSSTPVSLVTGANMINIIVIAQDGVTTQTYTLTVTRAPSANAGLSGLQISSGTLSPAFATGTITYAASVLNSVSSVTLTPTTSDANATVMVNGIAVVSGSPSPALPLSLGANIISTVVTAQTGATKTYKLTITRPKSTDASLAGLALSVGSLTPAFSSSINNYTVSLSSSITSITEIPQANNANASIKVNGVAVASGQASGPIPVSFGTNIITTTITAQDGTTTATYIITLNLSPPTGPPVISYPGPQTYTAGIAITALSPGNTGGLVSAAFSSGPEFLFANQLNGDVVSYVTADPAGNLYADWNGGNIVKIVAGSLVTVANGEAGMYFQGAITIDTAGNIYALAFNQTGGNNNYNAVEIKPGGGSPVVISTGFDYPSSVAVDGAGNVYVCDEGASGIADNTIKKVAVGGAVVTLYVGPQTQTIYGMAADLAGNVYFTTGANIVYEIPAAGGAPIAFKTAGTFLAGISIDKSGNLYVADRSTNNFIEFPVSGGSLVLGNVANGPGSITVDNAGNVFIQDEGHFSSSPTSFPTVYEFQRIGGYFINRALPAGLNFDNTTGTISGTPTAASPATNYTVTAYNVYGSGSATLNLTVSPPPPPTLSYNSPQTYMVGTAITSLIPTNNNVASAGYSTDPVTLGSGFSYPAGVAADTAGNVYLVDLNNNAVKEIPKGGGATITLGSGFIAPTGIAVDAAGNVYVTDGGHATVSEIPAGGGATISIGSGFIAPYGIAVDAKGNVYVSDYGNSSVEKIPVGGGAPVVLSTIFNTPRGVAVDASGNVYVADYHNNAIYKLPAGGGSAITIGSGFNNPNGVAVDAAGNIFVADESNDAIKEIPAGGGAVITLGSGFSGPAGVAVNGAGYVYVADSGNDEIKQIKPIGGYYLWPFLPAGLSFDTNSGIISGTPAIESPAANYTVTAYNAGGGTPANVNISVVGNSNLSSLALSSGTLSPVFKSGTIAYQASVSGATNSITVTPTASDVAATLTVNGTAVTSGEASGPIALNAGPNVISVMVTAADGSSQQTYTITVTRALSTNDNLFSLKMSSGIFSPAFTSGATSYTDVVGNAITSVTVTPTTADPTATLKVNGNPVSSGTASQAINLAIGSNQITVTVTAQDGKTTQNYVVTVIRSINLSSLKMSKGIFSPTFVGTTTSYTDAVGNTITSVTVTPATADPTGTIKVNGTTVPSGTASAPISLNAGNNTITVVVTSQDGSTSKTYTVAVTRAPSNNDNLSALAMSSGALSPTFASSTTAYTDAVGNATTFVTVTPAAGDPDASIKVNGTVVPTGTASGAINLVVGPNTINVTVTASDKATVKTYTVTVTRAPSNNDNLSSLKMSKGIFSPTFATTATSYTDAVGNTITSVTVTSTTTDPTASVKVNGTPVSSGTASGAINLNVGNNTINVTVTAQDGTTTKTYTVTVTRAGNSNDNLSSLKMSKGIFSPAFASTTTSYADAVGNTITSVTVTPTASDPNATVKVNGTAVSSGTVSGAINLNVGANTINVAVTASDGTTTKTYTVTVTRAGNNNDNLSSLKMSKGIFSPAFAAATTSYADAVGNTIASVTVTPAASDPNATIKVNGTTVASGTASGAINLAVGANTISVAVTASDKVTTKTYTVTVTRPSGGADSYNPGISVTKPFGAGIQNFEPLTLDDGIQVHQGVSPNGDGINDFLQIDNISRYPDNKLMVMNRNGQLVYEASGYDNSSKVFDGHSNKNGQMQLPGTYFYQLDYTINGITKHKTGFIILKY